jgi:HD-like signal output (HDOD) protein
MHIMLSITLSATSCFDDLTLSKSRSVICLIVHQLGEILIITLVALPEQVDNFRCLT